MIIRICVIFVFAILLSGCRRNHDPVFEAWERVAKEAQRQTETFNEQARRKDAQMDKIDERSERLDIADEQARQNGVQLKKLIERLEQQADRFDTILDRLEKSERSVEH